MKNHSFRILIICTSLALLPLASCKKWLDYPPEGNLREDLFNTATDAQETLNSCYDALANTFNGRIQALSELLSDNLQQPNSDNDLKSVYARQTTFFNGNTIGVYKDLYTVIWRCNTLLDNIDFITDIDEGTKSKLIAEAKFLRGFCHWSAVKLWAQPYGYTADNSHPGVPIRDKAAADPILRSTVKEVYDFVIADLTAAYESLPLYNSIYASKYSAAGVLAQVYFLMSDYNKAVEYSDAIINSGVYTLLPTLERMPEIYNAAGCRHPLISEYYEDVNVSGPNSPREHNSYIELHNPTENSIDLTGYTLRMFADGSTTATIQFALTGQLAPGQNLVIASPLSYGALPGLVDVLNATANFSGNDAVGIFFGNEAIDVIGNIGNNPGQGWTTGGISTKDGGLRRKKSIAVGSTKWAESAQQWIPFETEDFTDVGSHISDGCIYSNTTSEFIFGTVSTYYDNANTNNILDRRCGKYVDLFRPNNGIAELMLSTNFVDFIQQNPADQRIASWIEESGARNFLLKYYTNENFSIPIIHLTEIHLIRAEALAQLGSRLTDAIDDVNKIRNRAFVPGTNELAASSSADQIIEAARREYRIETIGEGKYVEQLRRRGTTGENILIRNASWNCPGMALQFPNAESTVIGFELNPEGGCN